MFLFGMGYKGDLTNGENVEALQLQGYIPLQEDNDNVILPEGTYTISTSADNTDAFTLVAGGVDAQNGYQYLRVLHRQEYEHHERIHYQRRYHDRRKER